jgi:putative membrane protein
MTGEGTGESPETDGAQVDDPRYGTRPETPDAGRRADDTGLGTDLAPRRTLMAAERTYLAWLRTGLGALAVSIAVGRVAPALLGGSHWAYALLGAGYGVLGVFFIVYAVWRAKRLDAALAAGVPVGLDWWALAVTTVLGLALAITTIAMVLVEV